jgi:phosphatidylglycerophosphate synthase
MKDDTFQWSFIGIIIMAVLLIVLAAVGVIPLWVIAIAIVGGIAIDVLLLYYWGKKYMSRY